VVAGEYLEGAAKRLDTLSRDHRGPRAVIASPTATPLNPLASSKTFPSPKQLRDFQEGIGKTFLHEQYLSELTSLRDH
jgi:hypothetical protein